MPTASLTKIFSENYLSEIAKLDEDLSRHFKTCVMLDKNLTRQLVSFQANKKRTSYRWYKYKEAFSASLVEYFLGKYSIPNGKILDPFAGAGTALFASSECGYDADGIELLPIGQQIINNRKLAVFDISNDDISVLKSWRNKKPWKNSSKKEPLNTLRITEGAYSKETEKNIVKYLACIKNENKNVSKLLFFTLLCALESISYTRKDGQYLRWDYRSGRRNGHNGFNKGIILDFDKAITQKLDEIIHDSVIQKDGIVDLFGEPKLKKGLINLLHGSCLDILPTIKSRQYQSIITSPPYCNRYDYTRTYALELALLGISEEELSNIRQQMVSCTVENREKELLAINRKWDRAISICNRNKLLQKILEYLEYKKNMRELNNNGIPRMVRGYFYEMSCIIQECSRVLKKNGFMFMVNDNVRYAGASISVDFILSSIAEELGFRVENILILPQGKGNSSQQMGTHGREILRKCVYVWRKSD